MAGRKRRILLLGAQGQVGTELCRCLAPLGELLAMDHGDTARAIDLEDHDALPSLLEASKADLIVNAAAYTDVDRAERESARAHSVNGRAVAVLGECAARMNVPVIHYGTDYVFDGSARAPYAEDAPTAPLNVYGQSKLAGEAALVAGDSACLVLRTSWIYGLRGRNFLRTVLRLAREQPALRVVNDQHGSPTWARSVATVTALLVAKLGFSAADYRDYRGIYHLTNAGQTTWYGFAQAVLAGAPLSAPSRRPLVTPIVTADYPTPATRPAYSVLDNRKLARTFELAAEPWEMALAACLEDLAAS
ncbi:MAG: dTDP-4-dehydrorhamnose reductase [Proteobacteria bacterium]|nr:dTDP-4-dehydrorhamnose reductase [Pseudomonadota bacterium]